MAGVFSKFKAGLRRTTRTLLGLGGGPCKAGARDTLTMDALEEALYSADFGVETTVEIMREVRAGWKGKGDLERDAASLGATVVRRLLKGAEGKLENGENKPEVICLLGVNGVGKTTTAAKLAYRIKREGRQPLLAACDTFRAAANEQIQTWADRLQLELIASHHGADAAAVAYDAYEAARRRRKDVLILDTAGRLHTKSNLMRELGKIRRVLQKRDPAAPHHSWLVLDGGVGSNSIEQARVFHREFGLTGVLMTKLDGTSRGGSLVGIYRALGLPIYFVGLGERAEDLEPFSIACYTDALFGLEEGGLAAESG